MRRLAQYASGRDNNFNLLRLCAAFMVIYAHSFPMVQGFVGRVPDWRGDWLYGLTGMDSGRIGVQIFFIVSGFLVAQSLSRRPSLVQFFQARALRILPGLIAAVLATAFVFGFAFSNLSLHDYLGSDLTRRFLALNLTLRSDPKQFLPGVFEANPYASVVNGSLWTLPWEMGMYVSLAFFAVIGAFQRRRTVLAIWAAMFATFCLNRAGILDVPYLPLLAAFFSFFYLGVLLWLFRDRVPMGRGALVGGVAALAVTLALFKHSLIARDLYPILLAYTVIGLALVPAGPIRKFNRLGDYSYGVYVYAFPLQQSLMALFPEMAPLQLCAAGFFGVLLLAVPSWHLLEKPMLDLKPGRRRAPEPAIALETQAAR